MPMNRGRKRPGDDMPKSREDMESSLAGMPDWQHAEVAATIRLGALKEQEKRRQEAEEAKRFAATARPQLEKLRERAQADEGEGESWKESAWATASLAGDSLRGIPSEDDSDESWAGWYLSEAGSIRSLLRDSAYSG